LFAQPAGETLDFLPEFVGSAVEFAELDQFRWIYDNALKGTSSVRKAEAPTQASRSSSLAPALV
jgi:hypothetical protein